MKNPCQAMFTSGYGRRSLHVPNLSHILLIQKRTDPFGNFLDLEALMFDFNKYRSLCSVLQAVLKKGRGGIYVGGYDILGADAFGRQIISDSRHLASLKMMYVPPHGETCILAFMMCAVQQGMVFVEVGAGCGYYSIQASELVGKLGKVYGFEYIPECLRLLSKNLELNFIGNVIPVDRLVSDTTGNTTKKYFGENYQFFFFENNAQKEVETKMTSLDRFFDGKEMSVDFVKITSEGYLPIIFRGMKDILTFNRDIKILCAFNREKIQKQSESAETFFKDLKDKDFGIFLFPTLEQIEPEELLTHSTTKNILIARDFSY